MKELVIATTNQGKLREIKDLLKDFDFNITSLKDYPEAPEIVEDGDSFHANALIKAKTIAKMTGKLTMGEDSGLEVRALNDRPGIKSARFAGDDATDQENNEKLLSELKNVPDHKRQARYRCCAVLVDGIKDESDDGYVVGIADGCCEGMITRDYRGTNGFGYDPLFLIPEYNQTFGELDPKIKAKISHRAKALEEIRRKLGSILPKYPQQPFSNFFYQIRRRLNNF